MMNQSYHIIFDKDYYNKTIGFRARNHHSWNLNPEPNLTGDFGGKISDRLNRLFQLGDDNKADISGIDFAINFTDFFNAQIQGKNVFYQHKPEEVIPITKNIVPDIPYSNYPLKETKIRLAKTPESLVDQEWEGNCNRIGGHPIWVQKEEKLQCPICDCEMEFIFQLDSGLPDLNENNANEIMFGNDGMLYAFWCNKDMVSGYLWQCT